MEKPLKEKHGELIHKLYKPLIFYLPRKLWADQDIKWMDKEFDSVFDTVILMRKNGHNYILDNGASSFYMLGKTASLDENIYELLDMKAGLSPKAFHFLSERYSLSVAFYRHVSNWMAEHVKEDVFNCSEETIRSFEIQKAAFDKHWDYIQEHFPVPDQTKNYFDNPQLNIKNIFDIPDFVTGDKSRTERIFKKLAKPRSNEKKILITGDEAERFLLKTVFNLQL